MHLISKVRWQYHFISGSLSRVVNGQLRRVLGHVLIYTVQDMHVQFIYCAFIFSWNKIPFCLSLIEYIAHGTVRVWCKKFKGRYLPQCNLIKLLWPHQVLIVLEQYWDHPGSQLIHVLSTRYHQCTKLIEAQWRINLSTQRTNIGSDNGLSPVRCQAITWTNAAILSIRS